MNELSSESVIEAALFAVGEPLSIKRMQLLYSEQERPSIEEIKLYINQLQQFYQDRGIELIELASGYTFRVQADYAQSLQRYWEKRPPRYSKALLETLAIIAYKQPITRGQIEDIRGVVVSTHIMKTLQDREWVKIVGYREVPGKPALYATTKHFLDYFQLKKLSDLPALEKILEAEADSHDEHMQKLLELAPTEDVQHTIDTFKPKQDVCVQHHVIEECITQSSQEEVTNNTKNKVTTVEKKPIGLNEQGNVSHMQENEQTMVDEVQQCQQDQGNASIVETAEVVDVT